MQEHIASNSEIELHKQQRRFKRLRVDIRVQVFALIGGNQCSAYGRGHDVGQGGMAVYVPLELEVDDIIKLRFELPYSRTKFGLRAAVRNRSGFRYGIEFLGLSQEEKDELGRVSNLLKLVNWAQ